VAPLWAQETAVPADAVSLTYEQKAKSAELIEWVYTMACGANGYVPSLRVTLGLGMDSSASAGVAMAVDEQDRALGTIRLRAALTDPAAGIYTLTLDIGPNGPTLIGQTLRLKAGQNLAAAVDLRQLPAQAGLRHAIIMGTVGGCPISAFVMPGRATPRTTPVVTKDPAVAAAEAVAQFRTWVRGVKSGDLEQFGAGMSPPEWSRLAAESRSQRLREYQESFATVLGADFNPDLFNVEYDGGPVGGKLRIQYGDKELPELSVRFYNGAWVLSEP
jgi:hypothetical protein